MIANLLKAFSILLIVSTASFSHSLNNKTQKNQPQQPSNVQSESYDDKWSDWATQWQTGWSADDKHVDGNAAPKDAIIEENVTLFGEKSLSSKTIKKNLTIYGETTLHEVTVEGVFTGYGRLVADKSTFNQLDAYGCSTIHSSTATGLSQVYGLFDAHDSEFDALHVWSSYATLTDSIVKGDIVVKALKKTKEKQTIELENTIVEGSIIFEKNKGTVILKGNSAVKGDIVGATVKENPVAKDDIIGGTVKRK